MIEGIVEKFQKLRKRWNEFKMDHAGLGTKRFFSLNSRADRKGVLPLRVEEMPSWWFQLIPYFFILRHSVDLSISRKAAVRLLLALWRANASIIVFLSA